MPPNEQQPIKNTDQHSFFASLRKTFEDPSPEYQRWKVLLNTSEKTIVDATEQVALSGVLGPRTTGRYAITGAMQ